MADAELDASLADRQAWAREVAERMNSLPDTVATALRVVYGHGMSFDEAAAWMGLTVDDVHSAVDDGLGRLRGWRNCEREQLDQLRMPSTGPE